ncbi:MAG: hypothetical protein QUS07_08650 [Methanothrix sp.]|nr:hypothetical protein [Methanothrix sp.]
MTRLCLCPRADSLMMRAAAILVILLLLPCASADVKVEGWREQSYDYVISNINEFPEYVFLTSSAIWGWEYTSVINSTGHFGGGYKLDSFIVHAVKASDLDWQEFSGQENVSDQQAVNCTDYCQNNALIVSSNLTLPKATSVQEIVPPQKIEVFLKVGDITSKALNISKTKMVYYYSNGTVQEMAPE